MTLHDGTPRRPREEPGNGREPRSTSSRNWILFVAVVVVLAILAAINSYYRGSEHSVTNAPAGTPPSTQTPSTTPPVHQEPSNP